MEIFSGYFRFAVIYFATAYNVVLWKCNNSLSNEMNILLLLRTEYYRMYTTQGSFNSKATAMSNILETPRHSSWKVFKYECSLITICRHFAIVYVNYSIPCVDFFGRSWKPNLGTISLFSNT